LVIEGEVVPRQALGKSAQGIVGLPGSNNRLLWASEIRATKVSDGTVANGHADAALMSGAPVKLPMRGSVWFIEQYGARLVATVNRTIECRPQEGINYLGGRACPQCAL
jgi:hypothetical protein